MLLRNRTNLSGVEYTDEPSNRISILSHSITLVGCSQNITRSTSYFIINFVIPQSHLYLYLYSCHSIYICLFAGTILMISLLVIMYYMLTTFHVKHLPTPQHYASNLAVAFPSHKQRLHTSPQRSRTARGDIALIQRIVY